MAATGRLRPFTLARNSNTRMSAFSSKAAVKNTDLDSVRMSAFGHKQSFGSTLWRSTTLLYPFRDPVSYSPMHLPVAPGTA